MLSVPASQGGAKEARMLAPSFRDSALYMESASMDFVDGLPKSRKGNTGIWVIVDRLTKSAHFIPDKRRRTTAWLASVYLREIVRLHGIPSSTVRDIDPIFTSEFWKSLQEAVGTQLCLSMADHPQTDS